MSDKTYNGWTNRATWLVNVWGNPESKSDVQMLRADLEEQYDALPDGILKDMLCLDEINWEELEAAFDTDEPENNNPVMVTVGDSGGAYEEEGSEHVAFFEDGNWYYQDTAEKFKAPVASWRELTEEETWNL